MVTKPRRSLLLVAVWVAVAILCAVLQFAAAGCQRAAAGAAVEVRPLTFDTADDTTVINEFPAASPDGRYLLFQRSEEPKPHELKTGETVLEFLEDSNWDIYRLRLDNGDRVRLTEDPASEDQAVWSPDGRTVAYRFLNRGSFDIYLMDPGGGNKRPLLGLSDSDEKTPAFSPDGRQVVFFSDLDGAKWNLYSVDLASRKIARLTHAAAEDKHPQFTPDGKEVVFHSDRRSATTTFRGGNHKLMNIFSLDLASRVVRQLTPSDWEQDNRHPWSSPDGRYIAYHTARFQAGTDEVDRSGRDLWVMTRDGSRRVNLTKGDKRPFKHPSWSGDSAGIYCAYKPGKDQAWAIGYLDATSALRELGSRSDR